MDYINTPADRFENLDGYFFDEHFFHLPSGMQVHYLDEGPSDASEIILLMHGEPSWSYLYRFMIPPLVEAGYRCIAPDLIGFGKSSKPTQTSDYTYARHIEWMQALFDHLQLDNLTLFCQDWGGLIGLRLVADNQESFARVVVSNTFLPTGITKPSEAFIKWRAFSQRVEEFPVESVLQGATQRELTDSELAGYRAPFPDERYTAGAKIFPSLVPIKTDDPEAANNQKAWEEVYSNWQKPLLTLFGDSDPVTAGGNKYFEKVVPGAKGQNHTIIEGGGHFIQEDKGPELARYIIQFIQKHHNMIDYGTRLLVHQQDFRKTKSVSTAPPSANDLTEGQALLRINKWAYTSNNTTYAVVGHMIGYWKFFPVSEPGYGIIPCWGFADVISSKHEQVKEGTRVYGFFPMASHLIIDPVKVSPTGFIDGASHRRELPVIYNQYTVCSTDPLYQVNMEELQSLYRPLFTTSFLIQDMFSQNDFFEAQQIVLTSASSKTAMSLAYCLKDDPVKVVGLTSPSNIEGVKSSGLYDEVKGYNEIDTIETTSSSIVDFAGNHQVLYDLEHHLIDSLKYVCLVGFVHWESDKADSKLPVPGKMFFAPSYAAERIKELGPIEFGKRLGGKYMGFLQSAQNQISIVEHNGIEALTEFHQKITNGNLKAKEGHIVKL